MEFKERSYSVVEDNRIYNVTVIKQGNSMQNITVNILASSGTARCEWLVAPQDTLLMYIYI